MTSKDQGAKRYAALALKGLAVDAFRKSGLALNRAETVASILLEADLLGFRTHGFQRLKFNVDELTSKRSRVDGAPVILSDCGAVFNWDADRLPGPYVVREALIEAQDRARRHGVGVGVVRRAQHIACLAAYLPEVINNGFAVMICASTPDERVLVSPNGTKPVLSNNPLAFGVPSSPNPCFFDISMASVTCGSIKQAQVTSQRLKDQFLRTPNGELTDDPNAFFDEPAAGILPFGGEPSAHKGFLLSLWIELMTSALGNFGPKDVDGGTELNSVFVQVFDPDAFGSFEGFKQQVAAYQTMFAEDPAGQTRLPGERAWQRRQDQLENGVFLAPNIVSNIEVMASELGLEMPKPT
ncbi:MAG: Ldh family oxidoreductase [Pseudomonadota bacterium]